MELSVATLLFLSLMFLVSLISRKWASSPKGRRPPGPWRLPLVGSLHHLLAPQRHVALRDLAEKHGPVMYLRLGQVDAVVVSSPALAQEVLRDKNLTFTSRPRTTAAEIVSYGNLDIAFAPYGAYWRTLRKLCTVELLSERKVRQFAPLRDRETMAAVRTVRCGGGEPVNVSRLIISCSNAITGKATFGEASAEHLQQFDEALERWLRLSDGLCLGDLFPSLWFVDVLAGTRRRLRRAHGQIDAVIEKMIGECEGKPEGEDLLRTLLRIRDEGQLETPIGTTSVKAIVFDMFAAGAETTSAAAEWTMSELMKNPDAMAKASAEVRQAFAGASAQDHEVHLHKLRYLKMVIKESMRLHPVLPLLLPRDCQETCDVGGFEVAKGSMLIINAWAVARSHSNGDADEFRPERFDDSAGETEVLQFPFGAGRRMCPGNTFALAVLELMLARLLYYFDWSLPAGTLLDMDAAAGSTVRRRNQLHLLASPVMEVPAEI